jgi:serine/threonine-protein kinase HipA
LECESTASIYAYSHIDSRKAKLAMKVGNEYRVQDIDWANWRQLASEINLSADDLMDRARSMAANLPDALSDELARARTGGLSHRVLNRLELALADRARKIELAAVRAS